MTTQFDGMRFINILLGFPSTHCYFLNNGTGINQAVWAGLTCLGSADTRNHGFGLGPKLIWYFSSCPTHRFWMSFGSSSGRLDQLKKLIKGQLWNMFRCQPSLIKAAQLWNYHFFFFFCSSPALKLLSLHWSRQPSFQTISFLCNNLAFITVLSLIISDNYVLS